MTLDREEKLPDLDESDISILNNNELFHKEYFFEIVKSLNLHLSNRIPKNKIDPNVVSCNKEGFEKKRRDSDFIQKLIKQINIYINYMNKNITGKVVYLNFETEVIESDKPIDKKLNINLKKRLFKIIDESVDAKESVVATLTKVFIKFSPTFLEQKGNFKMRDFFEFIKNDFAKAANSREIQDRLNDVLKYLETDQLLVLIVLQDLAYLEYRGSNEKIY